MVFTAPSLSNEIKDIPDWVQDAVFYQIFPDSFAVPPYLYELGKINGEGLRRENWQLVQDSELERRLKAKMAILDGNKIPYPRDYFTSPTNFENWMNMQGGNFWEAIKKLEHLHNLGINALYLNPPFVSTASHGYHITDYYHIEPRLGGDEAFRQFVERAHSLGMRVILDGVFNHTGTEFSKFRELRESEQTRDWYYVNGWPIQMVPFPNYDCWSNLRDLPKLNLSNSKVQNFIFDVAAYWLSSGIDGWRLDVPNEIKNVGFWHEFRRRCREVNPDAYLVGEFWRTADNFDGIRWLDGDIFDGQMNYPLAEALMGFFSNGNLNWNSVGHTGLEYAIPDARNNDNPYNGIRFREDLENLLNGSGHPDKSGVFRPEVTRAQLNIVGSHDTPRLMTLVNKDAEVAKNIYLALMTLPGAPCIYQGDEFGITGEKDPYNRKAIPWDNLSRKKISLLKHVKQYIHLRRELVSLRRGNFSVLYSDTDVIAYSRQYNDETTIVALNRHTTEIKRINLCFGKHRLIEKLTTNGETIHSGSLVELQPNFGRVWVG